MPLIDGEYRKLTEQEIQDRLEDELEESLGASATPGDLVTKQLQAEARTLAQNQEEALERVHKAAFLRDATGVNLDKVVDVIGLTRKEAKGASGVVEMWRDTPPTTTYTIPRGSEVQTNENDPVKFLTTQSDRLAHIDGFEDQNLEGWEQDVSSFSILNTEEMTGNHALEIPTTDNVSITTTASDFGVGTKFTADLKPDSGSTCAIRFGVQDQSNYIECEVSENAQDLTLRVIEDGTEGTLSVNDSANIPSGQSSHLEIRWGRYTDTKAVLYDSNNRDTELCSVRLESVPEWSEGAVSIASLETTGNVLVDELATRSVLVNIRAKGEGPETNVGANSITVLTNGIAGIEDVSNPIQTGNPDRRNTNFSQFATGRQAESDEELRERAFESSAIGGSATVNALKTRLRGIEGVQALTLKRNRQESTVDGLPPHSFEVIVYGGTDKEVAEAIFDTAAIDSHDVGGINGTGVTYSVPSDVTNGEETISFSRPNTVSLNIEVGLVVDENFIGETEIRSLIASHIGGTDIDGSFVPGLDVGEDLYEAILKREIVGPDETGVWEVSSLNIDGDGDGNDDTTTTASGAEVYSVADNEVAVTNARDGSITITTTQK